MRKTYEYIKSDCHRYKGKCNFFTILWLYIRKRTFRWQVAFRMASSTGITKIIGKVLFALNRSKDRIQIFPGTKIGYGLYIAHNGPVVLSIDCSIGNNCNISQCTTIGTNHRKAATIGDNVYIGPNVCIVEDVNIGDNVTIGAGSIVTKDIPTDATAAGNYAKVLNYNNPGRYIGNKWIIKKNK